MFLHRGHYEITIQVLVSLMILCFKVFDISLFLLSLSCCSLFAL